MKIQLIECVKNFPLICVWIIHKIANNVMRLKNDSNKTSL